MDTWWDFSESAYTNRRSIPRVVQFGFNREFQCRCPKHVKRVSWRSIASPFRISIHMRRRTWCMSSCLNDKGAQRLKDSAALQINTPQSYPFVCLYKNRSWSDSVWKRLSLTQTDFFKSQTFPENACVAQAEILFPCSDIVEPMKSYIEIHLSLG